MKCTDLINEAIKVLGAYFSYNQKIKDDKILYNLSNIQGVLSLWIMINLTLEGRIVIFKTFSILKIVFLALLTKIPHQAVKELEKIQKSFLWKDSTPKIRHETTCKEHKDSGLKNVDISYKIVQCFWIRRLYNNNFDEWKLIPLHLIPMSFGSKFKFHSNVFFKKTPLKNFLPFYRDIFINWKTHFSSSPETPACLLSQFLWFNKYIQIEDNPVCLTKLAAKNIDFLSQLFEGGSLKSWNDLKIEYNLTNETYFQWLQLKHAILHKWKTIIKQNPGIVSDLMHDHDLIKGAQFLTLEKLSSKELYSILITKFTNKPSSNVYFEKIFPNMKLDWRKIYILPRITTVNTYLRSFQYKILNNILFLNKKLFVFRKKNTPLCSFCNKEEQTLLHIFSECTYVIYCGNS